MEVEKKELNENQKKFVEWLESLKPWELLDMVMNCGFLLGKTVKPPEEVQQNGTERNQEVSEPAMQG